jgi:hypothetical protein
MATRVAVVAILAVLATGCSDQTTERKGAPPVAKQPRAASVEWDGLVSSATTMFFGDGSPPATAREVYAVLRRPLNAGDRAAAGFARSGGLFAGGQEPRRFAEEIGRPIYAETHLIAGTRRGGFFATPTTAGAVCTGVLPTGGSSCGKPGPHGFTMEWGGPKDGSRLDVYGMAGDDVQAVEISVFGKPRTATVEDNTYVLEVLDASSADMGSPILHLTDDTTVPLGA